MDFFKKSMLIWLVVSFIFWIFYIFAIEFSYQILYYFFIIIVGLPVWIYREKIKKKLVGWEMNRLGKFLILGYGVVLFEEIFAALFNHLSEGFNFMLYLERVGQFWMFNIFAFTGFYFAWYFLLNRYKYSYTEVFFIAGSFGLFSEGVIFAIFSNPIGFIFMTPLVIFVYGLMIPLPMLSIGLKGKKELRSWMKYVLSLLVIFLFSVIPIAILVMLRANFPGFFPPVEFIPL